MPEEEYMPQTQAPVEEIQPQAVPTSDEEFFSIVNKELKRDPKQSEEEIRALTEEIKSMQKAFNEGSKTDQSVIMAELTNKKNRILQKEEFKKTIAQLLSNVNTFGHSPTTKLAEHTDYITGMINGSKEPINKDGILGHMMPDQEAESGESFWDFDDIEDMIRSKQVDTTSRSIIKALVDDSMRTAGTKQPGEDSEFNYQKEHQNIKDKLVNKGDIRSLANDKIFKDRVFKDDLQSAIKMGTYKEMGIPESQVKDPTPEDGKITSEDAAAITSMILQDENLLKDYLADYFTKAMEQNWNNNLSPEVRRIKTSQHTPQTTTGTPKYTPQTLPLYDASVGLKK